MAFSYVEMMTGFGLEEYAKLPDFEPSQRAPLSRPLPEAVLGLFTSVGALLPTHRGFDPLNDLTFRLLPREVPTSDLRFEHPSPIRGYAVQDLNVAYPRDRLIELEQEGLFGRLAPKAVSMLGSITTYTKLLEQTVPGMVDVLEEMEVDVVLMVPFCPACHRATSMIARGLEAHGIPTITLTVLREMAQAFKPARPVFLDYPLGATAGRPNDPDNQRDVLRATLEAGYAMEGSAWHVHPLPFQWAPDGNRDWENEVREIYAVSGKEIHRARVEEHIEQGESQVGREDSIGISCAC